MAWVEAIATATTVLAICCLILYVVAILRMPTGRRPQIIAMDRFGRPLLPAENPDYHDTEATDDEDG